MKYFVIVLISFLSWEISFAQPTFEPDTLSGLQFWLRSDSVNIVGLDTVERMYDLSGNGRDAVQTIDAKRPIYLASDPIANNYPSVRFDGIDDLLEGTGLLGGLTDYTIFSVCRFTSHKNYNWVYNNAPAGGQNSFSITANSVGLFNVWDRGLSLQIGNEVMLTTEFNMLTAVNSNDSVPQLRMIQDGILDTTWNMLTATHGLDGYVIGQWAAGGHNLNGSIVEILLYNRYLSDAEICQVENYLRYRYFPGAYRGSVNLGNDITYGYCDTILDAGTQYESYLWSTGESSSQIIIDSSGKYWVTVVDTFGCSSSDTILVTFPTYNNPSSTDVCLGDSVAWKLGLGPDYSYLWNTTDTSDSIYISNPGSYYVTITDTTGCSQVSDTIIFVIDSFSATVSLGPDDSLCSGNSIGLLQGAATAVSYLWSTGDTTSVILIDTSDTFIVNVIDNFGCSAVDSIYIYLQGLAPIMNFSSDTVCLGEATTFADSSFTLDSAVIDTWLWDFGDGLTDTLPSPVHVYVGDGQHTVKLEISTDAGCSATLTLPSRVASAAITNFEVNSFCEGGLTQFTALLQLDSIDSVSSFLWSFGSGALDSVNLNSTYTYIGEGLKTASFRITSAFGCLDSVTKSVKVSSIQSITPALFFPPYSYNINDDFTTLCWASTLCGAATHYQLDTSNSFLSILREDTVSLDSVDITNLLLGQRYYWRVRYFDGINFSSWSSVRDFNIVNPISFPDLRLWLRSDSLNVIGIDTVERFYDMSGNGDDAVQVTTANRPLLIASDSLVNNHSSVRFDGIDDFLEGTGLLGGITSYTFLTVCKTSSLKNFNWIYNNAPPGSISASFSITGTQSGKPRFWEGGILAGDGTLDSMTTDRYYIIAVQHSNDSTFKTRLFLEGFDIAISDSFSTNTHNDDGYLLGKYAGGGFNLDGDIVEVILYQRYLTNEQLYLVEDYLRNRYFPQEYTGNVSLGKDILYGFCDTVLNASNSYESYTWSTGDTTSSIVVTQSGSYWVEVVDTFGFKSSDTIKVTFPKYNTPISSAICFEDTTVWSLQMGEGYSFVWSTGDTLDSIQISTAGQFYVTIQDTLGCSFRSDTINFVIDSFEIEANLGLDDTLCQGEPLALESGAASAVSYIWSPTLDITPTITITTSGTYSVFVTDSNGCTAQDTVIKTVIGVAPNAAFTFVSICEGDTTSFFDTSDTSASGGIVTWLWDFGDGNGDTLQNPKHFYSSPGTYLTSLTVVTAGDCSSGSMQTISIGNRPTANFGPLNGCSNTPIVMLDQSTITNDIITDRTWVIDTLDTVFGSAVAVVYPYEGNYAVTLVATSMNGCSDSITQTVVIDETPDPGFDYTLTCGSTEVLFEDASVVNSTWILANGYSWSFGDGNASTDNPTSTTYTIPGDYIVTLNVLAVNGCSATVSDTISVVPITVDADFEEDSICFNKSFQFMDASTAVGDSVILWFWDIEGIGTSNVKNPVVTYPDSGIYSVSLAVTSSENCVDSITKDVLVHGLPSVDFNFSPQFGVNLQEPVNFTNLSNGCKEYRWDFGDGMDTVTSENPTHQYSDTGVYQVTLHCLSDFKCPDSITKIIDVRPASLDVEVAAVTADCQPEIIQNITVTLVNKGSREITFLDLFVRIEGREPVREQWNGFLEPFELETYTFAVAFPLSATQGTNYICVWAESPNGSTDEVLTNNEQCIACDNKFEIIDLFPNPATDQINVWFVLPRAEFLEAKLYDKRGTYLGIAFSGNGIKGLNQVTISTADMTHGLYTLRIAYLESSYVRTFVVH